MTARRVELNSDPPIPIQLDGDVATTTPAVFEIRHRAIHVVTP
jgi:diacylglycerol kinase family enzyme